MADLKINTALVQSTAQSMQRKNDFMRIRFSDVELAVNRLGNSWDGAASEKAISKMQQLKKQFNGARYDVLDNFVQFMLQQVNLGYENTEQVNVSLADQFK